ncbi:uncharacterized protein BXZ73DRAFT_103200 [Epithele typhae]|uniref:uncharacterized protein n=1 Tax=Epithele typhae TaxID=378194 RepID=UPI002007454E|nr:uncharacterized protein BXZ73DRAFT_103200 [Epithele typhae]KAH9925667.1 hypothetical protein BXZ73DRAFT_103200 [Epithele typhae]
MVSASLLSLNDDVLFEIFSLLDRNEALAMSCTSKRAYRLAISHVFTRLRWSRAMHGSTVPDPGDPSEARALWDYMRAPEPLSQVPRVRHVHHFATVSNQQADAPLLLELLSHASNLRTIELWNFHHFVDEDTEGLTRAIRAMPYLKQACLVFIASEMISILPAMFSSSNIASLMLEFADSENKPDLTLELSAFISVLVSIPSVETLTLIFDCVSVLSNTIGLPDANLPSIRHFSLVGTSAVAASVVPRCSNLRTLSLWLYDEQMFSFGADDRWPAELKELSIESQIIITEDTARRMGRVNYLSVGDAWSPLCSPGVLDFLPLLKATRPFALKLQTDPVLAEPEHVWRSLCSAVPHLRSLEIIVDSCQVRDYVDSLLPALQAPSLLHLTLHFPPARHTWSAENMAEVDTRRATEVRRVEALLPLPPRLVAAAPSLRLLALRACLPGSCNFDSPQARAERVPGLGAEFAAELAREDEVERRWGPTSERVRPALRRLRELRAEVPRDDRWWWVEGEGAARGPVEIWREDGERARALIERADFDAARSLDGFYSAKCRYER